jgi:hypothetical protein
LARKYGAEVQSAIREAVARGERHSVALAKLRAGTLDPELPPVQIPERTFTYQWSRSQREQRRSGPGPYSDPYFAVAVLALSDDYTGSEDPKALAERTGWPLEKAREALSCIAGAAKRNEEEGSNRWRACDIADERRRAAGHPPR